MAENEHMNQEQPSEEIPKEIISEETTAPEPENAAPENQPELLEPTPESTPMEVHHHGHIHSKSKWKEYIFQFFMLFLAVFCGFLAEYQLEHKIEKDRAKELARSFYYELKNDSVNIHAKTLNRIKQENSLKYLMKYFADSSLTDVSKTFQINFLYGILFRSPSYFEPRTVVLEHLKNSGSQRYFKNDELQNLIGDISVAILNINDRQDLEGKVRMEYINPIQVRHYDFEFHSQLTQDGKLSTFEEMDKYEKSMDIIPFRFNVPEKFDRLATINELGNYCFNAMNSTRTLHFKKYAEVNARLLQVLREEYHLE